MEKSQEDLRKEFEEVLNRREENLNYVTKEKLISWLIELTDKITKQKEKAEKGICLSVAWKTHELKISSFPNEKVSINTGKIKCKLSTIKSVKEFLDDFPNEITTSESSDSKKYNLYMEFTTIL